MITEDYVSFETAKLLKEKGFNERLLTFYLTDEAKKEGCFQLMAFTDDKIDNNHSDHCYLAPTLQMAMKWLKVEHNILLFLLPAQENGKLVYLVEVWTWNEEEGIYESTYAPMPRKEPEEAVQAAIKYCLENLI